MFWKWVDLPWFGLVSLVLLNSTLILDLTSIFTFGSVFPSTCAWEQQE